MKRRTVICSIFALVIAVFGMAQAEAGYHVAFDFESGWQVITRPVGRTPPTGMGKRLWAR